MSWERLQRREIVFAPGENTFGLRVFAEVWWDTSSGKQRTYWKYGLPDGVQVLGLTEAGEVIAVEEFQSGVGETYLHLVGETIKTGEDPETAAFRGLREETGYEAGLLELLSVVLENSAKSDRRVWYFLARDCRQGAEGEAGIRVRLLPPVEFWASLLRYFLEQPETRHGAGNSLKAATLAFHKLGWLTITPTGEEGVH